MITDRNGVIRWVNRAFTTLTGHVRQKPSVRDPNALVQSVINRGVLKTCGTRSSPATSGAAN